MTILADRETKASGTTTKPEPPPQLPEVDAAQQFYLFGTARPAFNYTSPAASFGYGAFVGYGAYVGHAEQTPSRLDRLVALIASELVRLRDMRPGWDGRHGQQITPEALDSAVAVLARALDGDGDSAPPQIFPLPDGGLQIAWYSDALDLQVDIDSSGQADVLATQADGDVIAEGTLDVSKPSELATTLAKLVKDLSAGSAAGRSR
jgi:hypothetical protein